MAAKRSKKVTKKELSEDWKELSEGIRLVQAREPMSSKRFIELYTKVYNYCTRGSSADSQQTPSLASGRAANRLQTGNLSGGPPIFAGQELYELLRELLLTDLTELSEECLDKSGEALLAIYCNEWEQYTFTGKVINGIFSYLNRHFVRRESEGARASVYQVYQLALDIWKETVLQKNHQNITVGAMDLLEKERLGYTINATLVQTVLSSFIDLGLNDFGEVILPQNTQTMFCIQTDPKTGLRIALGTYQKFFEVPYLQNIREFYTKESNEFLHDKGNSVVDFMRKVEQRLTEEEARAEKYLHNSSRLKQRRECEDTLIRGNLDAIHSEFARLLTEEMNEDLTRSYVLVSRLDNALSNMTEVFRSHVAAHGHQKFEGLGGTAGEPKVFVTAILEVFRKFKTLVEFSFHNDPVFKAALDKACGDFINKNILTEGYKSSFKSAELLARFCDLLLKKTNKSAEEHEVEERQNDVMVVFKFLEDKDAFQKFYTKMFANRLVNDLSSSDDAESSMITKLKHACGFEYTSKLQRMYQDITVSRELQEEFKNLDMSKSDKRVISDFQVQILSTSSWPFSMCPTEFALPTELEPNIQAFNTFYFSKYNGRKLNWLFSKSRGELTTNCFRSKYIFQASTYQMGVLLMFNTADSLRPEEIQVATKFKPEILKQVIQGIVKAGICTFNEDDMEPEVKLYPGYRAKKCRVNINVPLKAETKKESEHTKAIVEEDRKLLLQACIVRIMKMRKVVHHQVLLAEVIQQMTSFKANVGMIKKCIDMLIEKEYMERVANEKDKYSYMA